MQVTPADRIADFTARGWWGDRTLATLFAATTSAHPERLALVDPANRADLCGGRPLRLTFAQVVDAVDALAARLFGAGLRRDDIALVQLPNIAELPLLYLAAARLGVVVSPAPMQYGRFELAKARQILGPCSFITTTGWKGRNLASELGPVFDDRCRVLAFGGNPTEGVGAISLDPVEPALDADYRRYAAGLEHDANDVMTLCWTSGTTGQPKCVPRTHNQWIVTSSSVCIITGLEPGDVLLCPFPFANMASIGGFLFPWLLMGTTLVLHHPMDFGVFLGQIAEERVTYTLAPPATLQRLLNDPELLADADLSTIRVIGSGGAPLSEWLVRDFQEKLGIAVLNLFGSNEGISLSAGMGDIPDPAQRASYFPRLGVDGIAWNNPMTAMMRTRLVDIGTGEEVTTPDAPGELQIWGAGVFDGYWQSPETNAEVFTADGYFRTGDLFEIAGEGDLARFYRFTGRCKDIIIRGGMKISPDEIDRELAGHPAIDEVAVVGYDDDVLHERIAAVVVPKPDGVVTLDSLADFLRQRGMAAFKFPERLALVDELPRNATGKVQRNQLKDLLHRAA